MTVISGSNVTLKISNVIPDYKQLAWFYNDNQKIVEQESKAPKYFKSQFKDRVRLGVDHTLFIYNVQKEDSSTYILKVLKESGREISKYISLEVLGEFGEPHSRAPDGPLGGFPGLMGTLSGRRNFRTGLIHFSRSPFLWGVSLGRQNPN